MAHSTRRKPGRPGSLDIEVELPDVCEMDKCRTSERG